MPTLAEAKTRHTEHYLTRLGQLEEQYRTEKRAESLESFDRDWSQIAAAHAWVADQDRNAISKVFSSSCEHEHSWTYVVQLKSGCIGSMLQSGGSGLSAIRECRRSSITVAATSPTSRAT
jgi:hypothetical protein